MLKHNPQDGFGDKKDTVPTNSPKPEASAQKAAFPKSSNWNDRIVLSDSLQAELSEWIDCSLALLEEAQQEFITTNSQQRQIRQSR